MQKLRRWALLTLWGLLFVPYFLYMIVVALMDITARILLSAGDVWRDYLRRLKDKADTTP